MSDCCRACLPYCQCTAWQAIHFLATLVQLPVASVRYVAISATIQNVGDIAEWLGAPPQGIFAFGEEVRPAKLTTIVKGFPTTTTDFLFERRLNNHLTGIIQQYSNGLPTLVFCR